MARLTALDVLKGASLKGLPHGAVWRLEAQAEILAHKMRYGDAAAIDCGSAQANRTASAIDALAGTPMEYLSVVAKEEIRGEEHTCYAEAINNVLAAMQALGTTNVRFQTVHYDQCAYCVLIQPLEV